MDFFVGLLTGAFVIIVLLTFFVMHVLHINLDLPNIEKCQQNGVLVLEQAADNAKQTNEAIDKSARDSSSASTTPIDITEQHLRQTIQRILAETLKMPAFPPAYTASTYMLASNGSVANALSKFGNSEAAIAKYFQHNNYQDLLATAVLNKIVDTKQNNNNRLISESTPDLRKSHYDGNSEENFNLESQSVASDLCYNRKQNRLYHRNGKLKNNFYKQQRAVNHISKVTTETETDNDLETETESADIINDSADDDYVSVTSSVNAGNEGTWKRNWLLKKKTACRLGGAYTASGNSMSMLVPDPKEDVRTLIGDKTTDEISDLSDIESEEDEYDDDQDQDHNLAGSRILDESVALDSLNDRLINKQLIGGQNHKHLLDELSNEIALNTNSFDGSQQNQDFNQTMKNEDVKESEGNEDLPEDINNNEDDKQILAENNQRISSSNNCPIITNKHLIIKDNKLQLTKQQADKMNTNFSTHNLLDTNINHSNNNALCTVCCRPKVPEKTTKRFKSYCQRKTLERNYVNNLLPKNSISNNINHVEQSDSDEISIELPILTPGSIAEREYKKWYNAVEMPNNPYTAEALKRRINGKRESCIDLPNINANNKHPTEVLKNLSKDSTQQDSDSKQHEMLHIKRYSRDYYINDVSKSNASIVANRNGRRTEDDRLKDDQANECEPGEFQLTTTLAKATGTTDNKHNASPLTVDVYKATVAKVIELDDQDLSPLSFTSESNADSDDNNTIGIYNFKRQQTIILRNNHQQPSAEQLNKRREVKVQANACGEKKQNVIWTMSSLEKSVIETDVAEALPSVKALAKAFQSTASKSCNQRADTYRKKVLSDSLRYLQGRQQTKRISKLFNGNRKYATIDHTPKKGDEKPSATSTERRFSSSSIDLKENIAFFENLK